MILTSLKQYWPAGPSRFGCWSSRAFVLVEFEGLSYQKTAQIEATRIGTIKSRVSRAKAALAQVLRGYDGDRPSKGRSTLRPTGA